ncbi:TPA: restriction endonuclease subunit S [Legionella pneumophila]|nr:restriction endonuclease subunit S [Legionella pneumophila]
MSWHTVKLSDVAEVVTGTTPSKQNLEYYGNKIPFITPSELRENEISEPTVYLSELGAQKARILPPSSVLVCCIGSLGKVGYARKELVTNQQINSLIFDQNKIYPRFGYHFCKTLKSTLNHIAPSTTVAIVNKTRFSELKIPVPPINEQKRIAAILDKADAVRRKRQQAIELSEQLLRSVFLDMFGDPVTNSKGWKQVSFNSVGTLERGKSKHRPRNDPILLGGAYPLIQTGDVANSKGYITNYSNTYSEIGLKQSKIWPIGTLCITIAANIAKTAILEIEACFPDSIVGFQSNGLVTIEYVQHWLGFLQKIIEDSAPESAQKNINLEILRTLKIPLPDIEAQKKFSDIVKRINKQKKLYFSFEKSTNELFSSLAQKAFNGELSKRFENELA